MRKTKNILKQYDQLSIITAILLLILLIFIFLKFSKENATPVENLLVSLSIEFMAVVCIILISYFLFRKIQTIKQKEQNEELINKIKEELTNSKSTYQFVDYESINWEDLLSGCKKLEIFEHYLNSRIRSQKRTLRAIFDAGGTIRIILPNYENEKLVEIIKQRFPYYDVGKVKSRIEETHKELAQAFTESESSEAKYDYYFTNDIGYYSAINIDDRILIISMYDHIRIKNEITGPTFIIDITEEKDKKAWFRKEFDGLIKRV